MAGKLGNTGRYISIAVVLGFLSLTPIANAGTWHTSKVAMVYPVSTGAVIVTFQTTSSACTNTAKYFYIQVGQAGVTQEALENMLSVVLTAAAADRAVGVNFDETSSGCYINRLYTVFN